MLAKLGKLLVSAQSDGQNVLDLMRLFRDFVVDELELRGQTQACLAPHQGTQTSGGLFESLLGALALAELMAFAAQVRPVDSSDLQVVRHAHFRDGDVRKARVAQLPLEGCRDHALYETCHAHCARIGS